MSKQFTPKDVAKAIGVSESSMKRWCDKGLIEFSRTVGGHRRISIGAVLKFLRKSNHRLVSPTALGLGPSVGQSTLTPEQACLMLQQTVRSADATQAMATIYDLLIAGRSLAAICQLVLHPAIARVLAELDRQPPGSPAGPTRDSIEKLAESLLAEIKSTLGEAPTAGLGCLGVVMDSRHQWLSNLFELCLQEQSWNVAHLAPTENPSLALPAIRELRPRFIWLILPRWSKQFGQTATFAAARIRTTPTPELPPAAVGQRTACWKSSYHVPKRARPVRTQRKTGEFESARTRWEPTFQLM